jgi:hypothetical protein
LDPRRRIHTDVFSKTFKPFCVSWKQSVRKFLDGRRLARLPAAEPVNLAQLPGHASVMALASELE